MTQNKVGGSGYGKPPRHSQFKKGQSGNPAGSSGRKRALKPKNLKESLNSALDKEIVVVERGRRKKIAHRDVIAQQLVNDASRSNPKARDQILRFAMGAANEPLPSDSQDLASASADEMIIRRHEASLRERWEKERSNG